MIAITFTNLAAFTLPGLSLLGLLISIVIQYIVIQSKGNGAGTLCTTTSILNCDRVLSSRYGKYGKYDLADFVLFYFLAHVVYNSLLLICKLQRDPTVLLVALIIPVLATLASIILQAAVIRAACIFCIAIILVIWAQTFFTVELWNKSTFKINFNVSQRLFLFSCLIASLWIVVKPFITQALLYQEANNQLNKWKANKQLFLQLLQSNNAIDTVPLPHDMVIIPKAEVTHLQLLFVLKPYCPICAKEMKLLYTLVSEKKHSFTLVFRFKIDKLNNNRENTTTSYILKAATLTQSSDDKLQILKKWYDKMYLGGFIKEINNKELSNLSDISLKELYDWNQQASLPGTPACFLNGYPIKKPYTVADVFKLEKKLLKNTSLLTSINDKGFEEAS